MNLPPADLHSADVRWLTLAIAVYGAIVATVEATFRWQEHRRGRASLVSLSTAWMYKGENLVPMVEIEVHNLSPEPIKVQRYGWFSEGVVTPIRNSPWTALGPPGDELEIAARDGSTLEGDLRDLSACEVDPRRPLVSWIRLTTGEEFTAPPIRIPAKHWPALDPGESPDPR